ncbi:ATP-binding cassette domain-containing protein [Xylophilus rhododendri]|uniref:ATP-binding cassette domain-containing protein n=1 Tax=Xylophilus rhododendri TaxID=2697032 RepID=A0A857J257_9BURK|nr:ABC transporter ATP-binding protein [Xylophilus rhododendri]QHI97806.1 ATP-binding cassette domain-containing protein [Xylophilus rhododendri]
MSSLQLHGIVKRYGSQPVVDGLDMAIAAGEFVSLLGPSGCGKTTLLRIIAGLAPCDAGRVVVGDTDVTALAAHRRNIGVVFQSYALFPHLTVGENIAFGLRARGTPRGEVAAGVKAALASVQLQALGDRPISALSGGQQQRVAVARALATRPRLVLLDEPLSALDRKLRETMQIELRQMLRDAGMTAIFVTHDQDEALVMSDRIAVMNRGRIEQFDTPEAIYARPGTPFALNFVGLSAQLRGTVAGAEDGCWLVDTGSGTVRAPMACAPGLAPGAAVLVGVRPEMIALGAPATAQGRNRVVLAVAETVYRGANRLVYFDVPGSGAGPGRLPVEMPAHLGAAPRTGERLALDWAVEDTLIYAAGTTPAAA